MTRSILAFVASASFVMAAKANTPPLDPIAKQGLKGVGYSWNGGQISDLQGTALNAIRFYSEGVLPRTGLLNGDHLAMVHEVFSADTLLPDSMHRVDLFTLNASSVAPIGVEQAPEYLNFYLPHTMPNGVVNVQRSRFVVYPDLLPGVDMWVYAGLREQRIAFVCEPGIDPSTIELAFEGLNNAWVDANGRIHLALSNGTLQLSAPLIYQDNAGTVQMLTQQSAGFIAMPGSGYDAQYTLPTVQPDPLLHTIVLFAEEEHEMMGGPVNPGLCWSTYFGGNRYEEVRESATDWQDNYYITGETTTSVLQYPSGPTGLLITGFGQQLATLSRFDSFEALQWTSFVGAGFTTQIGSYAIAIRNNFSPDIYIGVGFMEPRRLWSR